MRKLVIVVCVVVTAAVAAILWLGDRTPSVPEAGIPLTLAQGRAARVSNLKYEITLRIPEDREQPVTGRLAATFALADAKAPLAFDFAQPADHVSSVKTGGAVIVPVIANGHVVIPRQALVAGPNTIEFEFTAGNESLNRNDEYLYSLFVPARASLALPCFDQPDLKAKWRLSLEIPRGWEAVSNGREAGHATTPGFTGVIFDETPPLPTYLFAFAAGKFTIDTAERNGRTFRMFHRETDAAKVARNRDAIYDLHARALAWLEEYTGIPYAFGKFDFVLIPSFQFGGMEHAGAVYYNASGLMLDETATQNQLLGRANVISHETAHMWFGDLVTMKWFNDVWMKEVFANFMAAKIVNPSFPKVNHELRFLLQNYPSAYDVDRTGGSNPIRQELANLNEAGSLYGAIIYQKAPIVMRHLERLMGADAFRDGLRTYLRDHALGNATWPDLISVLDAKTPADLEAWSRAWVTERGRPAIHAALTIENNRITKLVFTQQDPLGRDLVWPQRIQIAVDQGAAVRTIDVALDGAETTVADAAGLAAPRWMLPVGGGLGYGWFELDAKTIEFLESSLATIKDPLTRGAALVAMWESMLEGQLPPDHLLGALLAALPAETDELNIQQMLDQLRQVYWRFTGADDRAAAAKIIEPVLRAGLDRAATTSAKAAWFGALRSVATTPETIGWLESVWSRTVKIPGLPLAEPDEAELALDLAVRDVADADAVLIAQVARFQNADRRARFQFVMPALSRDATTRDTFFESLKDVKNRSHESWVLEAMRYLNHPLRAGSSKKYVRPSLELVREIQRTGDIFFPKRWADAALSGYQSVQTAADVKDVIEHLPADYPPRLRWVLLSAADPLLRAARLNQ